MARRVQKRRGLHLAALAAVIGLVVTEAYRGQHEQPVQRTGTGEATRVVQRDTQGAAPADRLPERPLLGDLRADLFAPAAPQPPAAKRAGAPARPTPPPLPYRFAGILAQGSDRSVFLSKADLVFPVKVGETIDGSYRVDSIAESHVVLVYLPLGHEERIPIVTTLPASLAQGLPGGGPAPAAAGGGNTRAQPAAVAGADNRAVVREEPAKPSAKVSWDGPREVKVGSHFDVALKLTADYAFNAAPVQLRADPEYLEVMAVKPGKFFRHGEPSFSYRLSPDGSVHIGSATRSPSPAADAELLVITLRPVKPAASAEIKLASLNLQSQSGAALAVSDLKSFRTVIGR